MGVAALILGIISLVLSIIPIVGIFGIGLAILGLIFGIVDWVQKKKKEEKHSQAVAGVVCSVIAIVIVLLYTVLFGVFVYHVVDNVDKNSVNDWINNIRESDFENYDFNYYNLPFNLNTLDL